MEKAVRQQLLSLWNKENSHDVFFTFPESQDDDTKIGANKTLLALISPVFEAMFFGELAEQQNPVPILDVEPNTFSNFLRCIYTDEFLPNTLDDIANLLYVAHKYEVKTIERTCEKHLIKNCRLWDIEQISKIAEFFHLNELLSLSSLLRSNCHSKNRPLTWIPYKKGDKIPNNMFIAGFDTNGWPFGIGRFSRQYTFNRDLIPGKFDVVSKKVTVSWGNESHESDDDLEILCDGHIQWVPYCKKSIKFVEGGKGYIPSSRPGFENLYICKAIYEAEEVIGKFSPNYNSMFFPYNGKEVKMGTDCLVLAQVN